MCQNGRTHTLTYFSVFSAKWMTRKLWFDKMLPVYQGKVISVLLHWDHWSNHYFTGLQRFCATWTEIQILCCVFDILTKWTLAERVWATEASRAFLEMLHFNETWIELVQFQICKLGLNTNCVTRQKEGGRVRLCVCQPHAKGKCLCLSKSRLRWHVPAEELSAPFTELLPPHRTVWGVVVCVCVCCGKSFHSFYKKKNNILTCLCS